MAVVIVDGQEIELADDERLNGIQAAQRAGIEIPHYCWHPGLSVVASCRMCLVETGRRDAETGEVQMLPKLVPACQTPATDQTVFVTKSDKVRHARAMVEEDLLLRHPVDCPICDKAGECRLQDYYFEHGTERRRADIKPFHSRKRDLGPTVRLFVDRCVMCTRCVRFCREVAGTSELMVQNRGAHEEIAVFPGFPLDNKLSGNVVDLCPVGALGDRDFLYQQRVWYLKPQPHVCGGCATGCSIWVDQNQDHVYRLRPRENRHVNGWWMCDDGRYGWKYVHSSDRWQFPREHVATEAGRVWEVAEWDDIYERLKAALAEAKRPVLVLSPMMTSEEAYLAVRYWQSLAGDGQVVVGRIPAAAADETFPGGFVIDREKCPNRRGVELVARSLCGDGVPSWQEWSSSDGPGQADLVWVTGGYAEPVYADADARVLSQAPTVVVQALMEQPIDSVAQWLLPTVAFLEREGSFVNRGGRRQAFTWAVRPPVGSRSEGQVFWRLSGRRGLYRAASIEEEMRAAIPEYGELCGELPSEGVELGATGGIKEPAG